MTASAYHGTGKPGLDTDVADQSDTVDMVGGPGILCITVGGVLKIDVRDRDGVAQTRTVTVPAGVYPVRVYRVWAGTTTCTGISVIRE